MFNRVATVLECVLPACVGLAPGLLLASVLTTAAPAQVVFEADLAVTQHVIRQPMNTIGVFIPGSPSPRYRERHPFVKYYCLWNCFGSFPGQPELEIYEESPTGEPIYRFDRLTVHIDAIVAEGLIPFLVLGGCPLALTSKPYSVSGHLGVVTTGPTPQNYGKYRTFVKDLFEHFNARYGARAVASWRYRFMSEPECSCWWTESQDQWFTFYDYTVSGARLANPDVRIAPANFMQGLTWLTAYAQRVQAGTFAVPGESAYPPTRFAHTYYKPWVAGAEPFAPAMFQAKVLQIRSSLAPYSAFNNIPLGLDEGFVGVDENLVDLWSRLDGTEWGGAQFAGICEVLVKHDYEYGVLWNPDLHDCPTPARHEQSWMHSIDGAVLLPTKQIPETLLSGHSASAIAARRGPSTVFLVAHAHDLRGATGNLTFTLRIKNVVPGTYRVARQRTDGTHGNYRPQWLLDHQGYPHANGSPYDQDPLSSLEATSPARQIWSQNFATYQRLAFDTDLGSALYTTTGTTLEVPVDLPTHSVEYLVIDEVARSTGVRGQVTTASYDLFGQRCAANGPLPSLAARQGSLPRTGSTLVTEVTNLQNGALPFFFVGLSKTSWRGIPLPLELSIIGLPGCYLLSSDDLAFPLLNVNGTATWSLSIPLNPQLHGAVLYNQALVFSAAFQPMSVTNGGAATIGL